MELTTYERELLLEVLDIHLQGMSDTRVAMLEDTTTFKDAESFASIFRQHDLDVEVVESIRKKVLDDV